MNAKNFVIGDLRDSLRKTLAALQDAEQPLDLARAKAICDVSGRIIDTARVEIDYLRVTNSQRGSGFIPHVDPVEPESKDKVVKSLTQTGVRTIEQREGGTVTTHRLR